mgnify:CR=1 FL=1
MVKQTSSQGRTVYKDINIGNYLALLDPSVPETGEPMPFLGSVHTEGYVARQDLAPGKSVSMKLASADITGLTVTKRDFDFLGFLDQLITTREATPAQIVPAVFQVYRSFGVSDVRMRDYEISIPVEENPGQPITLSMGEIGMSDLSSDRIGEVVVSHINTSGLPEGAQFSLGQARLGNLDFAPYGPMTDLISALIDGAGDTPPDAMQIARVFAPRSISYGLENLHVVAPGKGEVTIGKAEQSFSTTIAPIPTDISTKTENASIPVAALNDPKAAAFLEALGLEQRGVVGHDPSGARLVSVDDDVRRDRDAVVLQRLVHEAAVEEVPLAVQVVHHERLVQLRVRLRLREGEPVAEPGEQGVNLRPLLHGLAQDALVAEDEDLELAELLQARQDGAHRLRLGLLLHGAHADDDLTVRDRHLGRTREGGARAGEDEQE